MGRRGSISVVVGGLWGSEGKGAFAGWATQPISFRDGLAIRVGGSQAGHTVYGICPNPGHCTRCNQWGHPWALRHVPVAAVTNMNAQLFIAAGSEIDLAVLADEVTQLEAAGIGVRDRLYIDTMATVIETRHLDVEAITGIVRRSGSTGKGVGAARADRVMRTACTVGDQQRQFSKHGIVVDTHPVMVAMLEDGYSALIEGTQGYGLGVHTPAYPHTTSVDCRAIDFMAQAGLSPWADYIGPIDVFVIYRPYPIRIAGNSGPLYAETNWEQLGLPAELTTVTRKTRRVGQWDAHLAAQAIIANGGPSRRVHPVIQMLDHIDPLAHGVDRWEDLGPVARKFIDQVEQDLTCPVYAVGTSPVHVAVRPE